MDIRLLLLCLLYPGLVPAQEFQTYYQSGAIQSVTPLNEEGRFHGLGLEFFEDGKLAAEVPYFGGNVHGIVSEYYHEGNLKLQHSFEYGKKEGRMYLYSPEGKLTMMAVMQADSVVFSQRFSSSGQLIAEQSGYIHQPVDTTNMGDPVMWLQRGHTLKAGEENYAQVFIQGFPGSLISFASGSGEIRSSGRADYPLILIPESGSETFTLYLRLKLHSRAMPSVLKKMVLRVN